MKNSYPGLEVHSLNPPRQYKHLGQVPISKQRSFQNLHQISIFLVYNQGYNLFFVPCVLVWLHFCDETETNHCEIPALSTWHESRERAVLDSIALRKHDTQRLFLICVKKNSICNLHVIGMPLNEQITSIFFSYDVVLPIASLWFPSLSIKPRNVNNVFSLVVCFGSTLFPYPDRSVSLGKNLMRFAVILQHAI